MTSKQKSGATRHLPRLQVQRVSVEWLRKEMPRYVVPSIHDSRDFNAGYSAAVDKLHTLLGAKLIPAKCLRDTVTGRKVMLEDTPVSRAIGRAGRDAATRTINAMKDGR